MKGTSLAARQVQHVALLVGRGSRGTSGARRRGRTLDLVVEGELAPASGRPAPSWHCEQGKIPSLKGGGWAWMSCWPPFCGTGAAGGAGLAGSAAAGAAAGLEGSAAPAEAAATARGTPGPGPNTARATTDRPAAAKSGGRMRIGRVPWRAGGLGKPVAHLCGPLSLIQIKHNPERPAPAPYPAPGPYPAPPCGTAVPGTGRAEGLAPPRARRVGVAPHREALRPGPGGISRGA